MTLNDLARFSPAGADEALRDMTEALRWFHRRSDRRAVFLRAYWIITRNVRSAIRGDPPFDRPVFIDPPWIDAVTGRFATLYFRSLGTFDRPPEIERAWKIAHGWAIAGKTTVVQDLLLGINAHINYDLAYAVFRTLEAAAAGAPPERMTRLKFDHDQINNILAKSADEIESVLTRDYGGCIPAADALLFNADELLADFGLRYFRERVWWNALSFLHARDDGDRELVRAKLDWESAQLAKTLTSRAGLPMRALNAVFRRLRKRDFRNVPVPDPNAVTRTSA